MGRGEVHHCVEQMQPVPAAEVFWHASDMDLLHAAQGLRSFFYNQNSDDACTHKSSFIELKWLSLPALH